jgi:8-oxo-dGTP pyrophosphatase MutT (NUDIX family)
LRDRSRAGPPAPAGATPGSSRRPVRPRDASSVVLVRGHGDKAEVLMGRRRSRVAFLPDIYVFPGGRVDREDRVAPEGVVLPPELAHCLARRCTRSRALALSIAAVRETFEETGLLLAQPGPKPRLDALPDTPFWRACQGAGALPALNRLDYVARAITPTSSPRRFNTRFFLARAEDALGELVADGELLNLHWVRIADAPRKLNVVDVTEFVLMTVARRLSCRVPPRVPLWHYVNDVAHVILE